MHSAWNSGKGESVNAQDEPAVWIRDSIIIPQIAFGFYSFYELDFEHFYLMNLIVLDTNEQYFF